MNTFNNKVKISTTSKISGLSKFDMPVNFEVREASVIQLNVNRASVKHLLRTGEDLVVELHSGEVITIHGFFAVLEGGQSNLVLEDDLEGLWLVEFSSGDGTLAFGYSHLHSIEPLLIKEASEPIMPLIALWGGGLAAVTAASAGSSGSSDPAQPDSPHVNPVNGHSPITGTAEPGSTVTITFPDGTTTQVIVGADGKFQIQNPGLQHGDEVKLTASTTDGGKSGPTIAIVDAEAPSTPEVDPVNGHDPITGSAEPGSTVTITFPDGSTKTVTAGANGSFSVANPGLEHKAEVEITATDAAGNTSTPAEVVVDALAPDAPDLNPVKDGGKITGEAEPGSTVKVTYPNGKEVTTQADANGKFTVPNPGGLQNGDKITATATDEAGNTSGPSTVIVEIGQPEVKPPAPPPPPAGDTTPPAAPKVNPVNGKDKITGNAEPNSTVKVQFPDGSFATAKAGPDGNFSLNNPGLNDGDKISVTATDAAGNTGKPTVVTVDAIAPDKPVLDLIFPKDPITGKAEPDSTVTIKYPDGTTSTTVADKNGNFTLENPGNLHPGEQVIVDATDAAGNTSPPALAGVITEEPTFVPTPVIDPVNAVDPITGQSEPGVKIKVIFPDGSSAEGFADENGFFSIANPGVLLEDGDEILVFAINEDGDGSEPGVAYVDATAPAVPEVDPNNGKDPITGKAEPDTTVTVEFPDGSTVTTVADKDGNFEVQNPGLEDGDTINVIATDPAGNTSEPKEIVVDATAPAVPEVDPNNGKDPITGKAEPDTTVTVEFPDGSTVTTVADKDGNFEVANPGLEDGDTISVTTTDPAGNTSDPKEIVVDATAPAVPEVDPNNGKDPIT
ncbi:Ig-like domain-containing protein, partial [Diaphorobacter sp.]|uniref:Ig-like domain-containing protein n=1 Tax=Diaphorobacter sp. TaxID=1934310 RepID=UPI0028AF13BD